jgi:cytochrome c oxidase subunit 2
MSEKEMHSAIVPPKGVWWKPAAPQEKRWVTVSFFWCMILFAMMPLWHFKGGQNPSGERYKVDPQAFAERTNKFISDYKVGEEKGIPVVAPPPGSHVYLVGRMWQWYPVLKLKKGAEYILHLSSTDVNHGFSLYPVKLNFQVVPGYDYGLKITPTESGDFRILCNEFCGIGHHMMVGKVLVEE